MSKEIEQALKTFLERFDAASKDYSTGYANEKPFPHVVLDGLFPNIIIDKILEEFPKLEDPIWHRTNDEGIQIKLRTDWKSDFDIAPVTRAVVHTVNSGPFLKSLARLTSIPHLIPDPYYTGGGLNCILPGGQLDVHADGNWHDDMAVHRRLNSILFLNKNWDESWGGDFQAWSNDLKTCEKRVFPHANRFFIFTTHDYSFHGHPEPLQCPQGKSRKSLIQYYYTSAPRPAEQIAEGKAHRALWRNRNQLKTT